MLIKECEDFRIYRKPASTGIYEVSRLEIPQRRPFLLNWIQQFMSAYSDEGFIPSSPAPLQGYPPILWSLRLEPITCEASARPPILIGATSGIRGNPIHAWPDTRYFIESVWWQVPAEHRILVYGPCLIRFFATLGDPRANHFTPWEWIGGRIALFSETKSDSEYLRGDEYLQGDKLDE